MWQRVEYLRQTITFLNSFTTLIKLKEIKQTHIERSSIGPMITSKV